MATLNLTFFGLNKPKPPKPAVSASVRDGLDKAFKGRTEPTEILRSEYRRYTAIKNKRAA
ncbi:hypothetical protein [Brevundimonas sp.]|uniref:hypothetical protein n=1 Tax=Brevundimonas sp. TaxID=1871086 RepID=UPI0025BF3AFC|nr:hypothetical protein [Brevundimonas sp.]